jgi:hypothetical protein
MSGHGRKVKQNVPQLVSKIKGTMQTQMKITNSGKE